MELGERLKQARLAAGLSQRQLCGGEITRNMLSQIENGSARPSMDTLRYLAARLGRSVSYFLEEDVVTSPNQDAMERAGAAWTDGRYEDVLAALEDYRTPDPLFDREKRLLETLSLLALAEKAVSEGRMIYAGELLERTQIGERDYCAGELGRKRLLLLAKARQTVSGELPDLDEELMLRARTALERRDPQRAAALLDAAEDQTGPDWNFLRGEVCLTLEQYARAADCYHRAENAYPEKTAPKLERCYRELEDFKQAYFYACKQR